VGSEKHSSGAKALTRLAAFSARLKSCPFTKPQVLKPWLIWPSLHHD